MPYVQRAVEDARKTTSVECADNTRDGVAIFGSENVDIVVCDFSDGGGSVVPGPDTHHNPLLSGVANGRVIDSRFDTSPWGGDLDLSKSKYITVENCEMARNESNDI